MTNAATISSTLGEVTPTSIPTEGSTSHVEWRRTNRGATENKTSGSMMMNNVEQSLPNQTRTLFAPVGIAEDLAKIQLILCEEIKTEIQVVKETIPTSTSGERTPVEQDIQDEIIKVTTKTTSEEAEFSSAELSVGCKTTAKPQMSESMCEPTLHSRDNSKSKSTTQKKSEQEKKKNDSKPDDTPMDIEVDTKEDENKIPLSTTMKEKGIWLYCTSTKGKTYYFKYFKAYAGDHRMHVKDDYGEPIKFHCPEGKIHHLQCPWYHPDVIYTIDFPEDLSSIELAAQQKIYNIYQDTIHNPPENCGCGTAAEIAYMGHNTACFKFQYIHERESHEVLLAILQKSEKVQQAERRNQELQSSKHDAEARDDLEEPPVIQKMSLE